ncbi:hypothetical protein CPB84DRAFT_1761738 [Gymnopilus junonius]|uniref:F-box domain-containing protein n=1 Tax=Gymnopilus junonius TaxID=109634 RepID=A0A9P5P2C5_GYMJU|nr:hypothetical protein CPB84DRAFT_1761738 [Gymnopilus junonius]
MAANSNYELPDEMWMECFDHFDKASDLQNLALTCRSFHGICLPLISRSISYSMKISDTGRDVSKNWGNVNIRRDS